MTDKEFCRWFADNFGYCYGTGEPPILEALKMMFGLMRDHRYEYEDFERDLGPKVAWLLINALCRRPDDRRLAPDSVFEYGTSPRFGWLTEFGHKVRDYMRGKDVDMLYKTLTDYDPMEDDVYVVG